MKQTSARTFLRMLGVFIAGSAILCSYAGADDMGAGGTTGSESVLINGKSAQRLGDQAGTNGQAPGSASPNVMINGKPAAVDGKCPDGAPPTPSPDVFINGKPAMFCEG